MAISAWAEFVMAFVQSGLALNASSLRRYARDVDGLRAFLNHGLDNESSLSTLTSVDALFIGMHGSMQPQPIPGI
jgi:hypothetical protein